MLFGILLLIVGFILLVVGAELLVRGASRIALTFGISPLVVGLTVVAFGTSAPEAAVSTWGVLAGQSDGKWDIRDILTLQLTAVMGNEKVSISRTSQLAQQARLVFGGESPTG